jgi:hypothetical protein
MPYEEGPIRIIDGEGVHPQRLNQAGLEQKLIRENRFNPQIEDMVFVFGSNEAGIHGAGAALYARNHRNARMGVSFGPTGSCFAIPTKDERIRTLALGDIKSYVNNFNIYASENTSLKFQVTQIGCGLAGLKPENIAVMFHRSPSNCYFDLAWYEYLTKHKFWGTG